MEELTREEIAAMAVAAIMEETGCTADRIRILSFKEAGETALDKYVREHAPGYRKYQLGDEKYE